MTRRRERARTGSRGRGGGTRGAPPVGRRWRKGTTGPPRHERGREHGRGTRERERGGVYGLGRLRPRAEKGGARPSNAKNCLFFYIFKSKFS
jgi:hypothetical protein